MKILRSTQNPEDAYVEISDGRLFPVFYDRAWYAVRLQTEQEFLDWWAPFLPASVTTPELALEQGFTYVDGSEEPK